MGAIFNFIFKSGLEEGFWSTVKWLFYLKIGGVAVIDIIAAFLAWDKLEGWQIFCGLVFMSLVAIWIVNGFIFYFYPYWQSKRERTTGNRRPAVELVTRGSTKAFWDEVKKTGHVWALWYNGGDAKNEKIFDDMCIRKLALLNGSDDTLMGYHSRLYQTPKEIQKGLIKDTAEAAEKAGIKVKYWPNPLPFSMTFFEPESSSAKVQLEIQIPGAPLRESLSMIFHKHRDMIIYESLLAFFKRAYPDKDDF